MGCLTVFSYPWYNTQYVLYVCLNLSRNENVFFYGPNLIFQPSDPARPICVFKLKWMHRSLLVWYKLSLTNTGKAQFVTGNLSNFQALFLSRYESGLIQILSSAYLVFCLLPSPQVLTLSSFAILRGREIDVSSWHTVTELCEKWDREGEVVMWKEHRGFDMNRLLYLDYIFSRGNLSQLQIWAWTSWQVGWGIYTSCPLLWMNETWREL